MKKTTKQIIIWAPRVLTVLFALFTSIFALDVFDEGSGLWKTLLALLMHLIPTFLIVLILVLSWRWEWIGAVLYIALAFLYVIWAWGRFPMVTYLCISGPLLIAGVLFFINWVFKAKLRTK